MSGDRDRRRNGSVYIAPDQVFQMATEARESMIRIEGEEGPGVPGGGRPALSLWPCQVEPVGAGPAQP